MSSREPYCPEDGDLVWIDFDPQLGREQSGRRPAIVLSPRSYNERAGLCVVCPITSKSKRYPFEVALPAGFTLGGIVLSDQVKSVSWAHRNVVFACAAPDELRRDVRAKLKALLGY
jgi:mRNA interferase MazF